MVNTYTGRSANITIHHTKNWYEHKPQPVVETDYSTIVWHFAVHTDGKVDANKPDITIKYCENNSCLLIELVFPMENNLSAR